MKKYFISSIPYPGAGASRKAHMMAAFSFWIKREGINLDDLDLKTRGHLIYLFRQTYVWQQTSFEMTYEGISFDNETPEEVEARCLLRARKILKELDAAD